MNSIDRERAFMRAELARNAGIDIGSMSATPTTPLPVRPAALSSVDRAAIRDILVTARAPAGDLEWLVASCIDVKHALTYRPAPRYAWCVTCDGDSACDESGCIACQQAEAL